MWTLLDSTKRVETPKLNFERQVKAKVIQFSLLYILVSVFHHKSDYGRKKQGDVRNFPS